ncbi:MAG: response regulator transcription factor [Candidatus Eisenbacteria bacterium]|nr:response regulator [Candidatus Eisenbacteria bacterium]
MDRKRILVVDDEIYIVHILEFSLTMEGFTVLTASNGEEALRMIDQERPDLVVLDIMMPKLDGYEVVAALRKDEQFQSLPVILLSAKGRPIDREAGLAAGADDYITKPFSPRKLIEKIREILDRQELGKAVGF